MYSAIILFRNEFTPVCAFSGDGTLIVELTSGLYTTDNLLVWIAALAIASVRLTVMTGWILGGSFVLIWIMFTGLRE